MALILMALMVALLGITGYCLARQLWVRPHDPRIAAAMIWAGGVCDGIAIVFIGAIIHTLVTR